MGLIELLVFYEHVSVFLKDLWEAGKEWMREQLGASSNTTYLLLENDAVIPATLVHCKYLPVATYNPQTKKISNETHAPYKRLPWLSVQHVVGDHVLDVSEWMSEVRSHVPIHLIALIRLASYIHSIHLPETEHATVRVITRDGEEEEYKYKGTTTLLQRIQPTLVETPTPEIHRRQTCPFDSMEGMPFF